MKQPRTASTLLYHRRANPAGFHFCLIAQHTHTKKNKNKIKGVGKSSKEKLSFSDRIIK